MVYSSLDKAKVGVRMGAQTQPKLLLAAAFAIIFVIGFLFGNMTKYCSFSRVAVKDVAITESDTSIDKEAALYVDLSAPDVTLPSIAKTSDKLLHEPSSCKANPGLSFVYFIFSVAKQVNILLFNSKLFLRGGLQYSRFYTLRHAYAYSICVEFNCLYVCIYVCFTDSCSHFLRHAYTYCK